MQENRIRLEFLSHQNRVLELLSVIFYSNLRRPSENYDKRGKSVLIYKSVYNGTKKKK